MSRTSSSRISRRHLAPPGPPPSAAGIWMRRLVLLTPAIALLWLLISLVLPLRIHEVTPDPSHPTIADIEQLPLPKPIPLEQRREHLASLRRDNPFAADRGFWRLEEIRTAQSQQEVAAPQSPPGDAEAVQPTIAATDQPSGINVTSPEDLPDDVRKALENIALRAIRMRRDATLVAMLSFNKGISAGQPLEYAQGDRFEDSEHPRAEWRVLHIDPQANRLFLARSSAVVGLDLFPRHAALASNTPTVQPPTSAVETSIEHQHLTDVMSELRRSGEVSDEEIDLLSELLGESPASEDQPLPEADTQHQTNPAQGMAELLKLMRDADRDKAQREQSQRRTDDPPAPEK